MEVAKKAGLKFFPSSITNYYHLDGNYYFNFQNCKLVVSAINDNVLRFRYAINQFTQDFSYAIDPKLKRNCLRFELQEHDEFYTIFTAALICKIEKADGLITIYDMRGNLISEDETGFHWEPNPNQGGNYVYCSKKNHPGECFFGLGDKTSDLNLSGKRLINWGTDTYGFGIDQDPLYRNIPFYYGLHNGIGYGMFFDNTFRSFFDFGYQDNSLVSFWGEGGEMNYYFIYGPQLINVAEQYAHITGVPEMPPLWALGYHQSKWSYYPELKVKEIANEFRSRNIPCDVIHLDIDYMDGFRCFTWDKERFPEPSRMIADLKAQGFNVVLIVDPGIKIDPEYAVYKEALEKGYFCLRSDGDLMHGKVWPGDCNFPDFTDPEVRLWWAGLFKEYVEQGVKGFWNDMNEPAVFDIGTFPDDVRHSYDGFKVSHRRAHNVYGMQMARATKEGVSKFMGNERNFVLTRSGYSGMQRYSATWTGDNIASWEHLLLADLQCQRLSISGVSFCGTDIGGFIGQPDGELFVRYIQMAIFHPFFRGHSSSDQGDKEPWVYGSTYEGYIRKAIELRYQLLPYIYTTFYQHVSAGTPMIRPLSFYDQFDSKTLSHQEEFVFGDNLLACPIKSSNSVGRTMYFPDGMWYNYYTGEHFKGGKEKWVDAPMDHSPIFVKAGAVLPHYPVQQYANEKVIDTITLHVYHGKNRHGGLLYEDDGKTDWYKDGDFCLRTFCVLGNRKEYRLLQYRKGPYDSPCKEFTLDFHGLTFEPKGYMLDGNFIEAPCIHKAKSYSITVPKNFKKVELVQ